MGLNQTISTFVLFHLACVASDLIVQQTHPGENVTLRCKVDGAVSIRAVEWTRDDLESPHYIIFYSDGYSDPTNQHPSFKDRVQVVDRELKNGDVSLFLRNISVNDNGTYECRVADRSSGRKKRAIIDADPITRIKLEVGDSGSKKKIPTAANNNHVLMPTVLVVFFLALVGMVI